MRESRGEVNLQASFKREDRKRKGKCFYIQAARPVPARKRKKCTRT